ncbi:hypothetical protein [Mesorhizobium sp. IMUNJ 23232]|uniref:hypothetical protein n=1 Tax=Mesorhizobium sp. IMUNJ 23232 TaxID=3376064 RepID=UPI0037BD2A6F
MNAAKAKALAKMESPADAAARQFAATWPADLATTDDLRDFLGDDAAGLSRRAIGHVIERAGMKTAINRRPMIAGVKRTVLIVRGQLSPDDLERFSLQSIAAAIADAKAKFKLL